MRNKIALALVVLGCAGSLMACSSDESKFAKELRTAGFGSVSPTAETEKSTKKIGGYTLTKNTKVLEAVVRVKGCDLEFEKVANRSGYWLDELHVNGREVEWSGYPENLNRQQAEALLADRTSKPDGFQSCYRPND